MREIKRRLKNSWIKIRAKNLLNIVGVIFSTAFMMFGIWQLDLIVSRPVWVAGWCHPIGRFADEYFECWLWKTTIGEAYNDLLFFIFVSFFILFFSLWFWRHGSLKK